MAEKKELSTELELEKYLKDHPELQEVMKLFGETMATYQEILAAMGQQQTYQITAGNTTQNIGDISSSCTRTTKIKVA